ncbi:MAG TPA: SDR family oxidoreductase, partial [Opitutales bacterium]|nr:SDR family oxidoreductase [Opitutales bacterium]
AISPGGVFNEQDKDFVRRLTNLIPLGRMARLGEYKAAVVFLVSDASAYMNGANLVMDGGRSTW